MWWFGAEVDELKRQQAVMADLRARAIEISASRLIQEVQENTEAAEQKYARKYLEVTGIVERTGKDHNGIRFALLHGGDANAKIKIECYFDFSKERSRFRSSRRVRPSRFAASFVVGSATSRSASARS
jgi:hypothetical protein